MVLIDKHLNGSFTLFSEDFKRKKTYYGYTIAQAKQKFKELV